jgi:DNA-binding Xre family transcriptional regulator
MNEDGCRPEDRCTSWEREALEILRVDSEGAWRPPERWAGDSPGHWLRQLRVVLRVSQRALAARSGVDQADISRFETGSDANWATIRRLFQALDCETALLVKPTRPLEDIRASHGARGSGRYYL